MPIRRFYKAKPFDEIDIWGEWGPLSLLGKSIDLLHLVVNGLQKRLGA